MSKTQQHLLAVVIAIVATIAVDAFTNRNPPGMFDGVYTTIAEDGLIGNKQLVAPYAYRFVWVYAAKGIADVAGVDLYTGFEVIAYISLVLLGYLAFLLARHMGASLVGSITLLLTIVFSLGHAKHTLYYRSGLDNLCQIAIVLFWLASLTNRTISAVVAACVGAILREFGVIPAVVLIISEVKRAISSRSLRKLIVPSIMGGLAAAIVLLPRLLIPVVRSEQFIDPSNPQMLDQIVKTLIDPERWFNILLGTASYLLPTLLLMTAVRFRYLRQTIRQRLPLLTYTALVMFLTLFGGTDITRFLTYLVLPQLVLLAVLFGKDAPRPATWELLFLVVVFVIHNNTFLLFPDIRDNVELFLDFYPAFSSRVTLNTMIYGVEILVSVIAINLVRWALRLRAARNKEAVHDG